MFTIASVLRNPPPLGSVGVEIEVEGEGLADKPEERLTENNWLRVRDGSLRGEYPNLASEFVFATPVGAISARKSIDYLFNSHLNVDMLEWSHRTSIHVHVNVGELTNVQVASLAYAYYLVEDTLMSFAGPSRIGNKFCLRIADAALPISFVEELLVMGHGDWNASKANWHNKIRYSSLNLESLFKFGSLEFRGMEGTSDVERIYRWIAMLLRLRAYAVSSKSPLCVHDDFLDSGSIEKFITRVFGRTFSKPLLEHANQVSAFRAYSQTLSIPSSIVDLEF